MCRAIGVMAGALHLIQNVRIGKVLFAKWISGQMKQERWGIKMKALNNISYGLFRKSARLTSKIRDIPIFISRIVYTLKHGYSPLAIWETEAWFTDTMLEILREYNKTKHGHPFGTTEEEWTDIIDEMIFALEEMREDNPGYDSLGPERAMGLRAAAKNEFMTRFSKWFFDLWD